MGFDIRIKSGTKANLPTLNPGVFALVTDTVPQEVYVGTASGNVFVGPFFSFTELNDVKRLTHSFNNFLGNSGMESWLGGTSVPPDTWQIYGATCARSTDAASGTYSAQITYSAAGQAFWNSFGPFGRYGVYTYSAYYKKISGTGGAYLAMQEADDPWTELETFVLDNTIDDTWRLATLSKTVDEAYWGHNSRFTFNSVAVGGVSSSVWLFDECMCQEGPNLSTTWIPSCIWDSGGGQILLQGLTFGYWNMFGYGGGTATHFIDIYGQPGLRIRNTTPPASATATGGKGSFEYDDHSLYIANDTNEWIRIIKDQFTTDLKTGRYHTYPPGSHSDSNYYVPAGRLYAMPWPNNIEKTVSKLSIKITSAGGAGKKARLGIYKDDGTIYPGARVLDAGEVAIDSATTVEITGLSTVLEPHTLYWLAFLADDVINVTSINNDYGHGWGLLGSTSSDPSVDRDSSYYVEQTYGALPATFPGSATSMIYIIQIGVYF